MYVAKAKTSEIKDKSNQTRKSYYYEANDEIALPNGEATRQETKYHSCFPTIPQAAVAWDTFLMWNTIHYFLRVNLFKLQTLNIQQNLHRTTTITMH